MRKKFSKLVKKNLFLWEKLRAITEVIERTIPAYHLLQGALRPCKKIILNNGRKKSITNTLGLVQLIQGK